MKVYFIHIYIFISLIFSLNLTSCKKIYKKDTNQAELAGYFMINHEGEENKPIPFFIIKTHGDTTYHNATMHIRNISDPESMRFFRLELREKNIEDCDISVFSQFKDKIYDYNKNNKTVPSYDYGTFKIDLIDNIDTLSFMIDTGEYAASFFADMERIATENALNRAAIRFQKYKEIQLIP